MLRFTIGQVCSFVIFRKVVQTTEQDHLESSSSHLANLRLQRLLALRPAIHVFEILVRNNSKQTSHRAFDHCQSLCCAACQNYPSPETDKNGDEVNAYPCEDNRRQLTDFVRTNMTKVIVLPQSWSVPSRWRFFHPVGTKEAGGLSPPLPVPRAIRVPH